MSQSAIRLHRIVTLAYTNAMSLSGSLKDKNGGELELPCEDIRFINDGWLHLPIGRFKLTDESFVKASAIQQIIYGRELSDKEFENLCASPPDDTVRVGYLEIFRNGEQVGDAPGVLLLRRDQIKHLREADAVCYLVVDDYVYVVSGEQVDELVASMVDPAYNPATIEPLASQEKEEPEIAADNPSPSESSLCFDAIPEGWFLHTLCDVRTDKPIGGQPPGERLGWSCSLKRIDDANRVHAMAATPEAALAEAIAFAQNAPPPVDYDKLFEPDPQ